MEVKSPIDRDIGKLYKIARLSFIRVRPRRESSISLRSTFCVGDTRDVSPSVEITQKSIRRQCIR